jgi:two-component system, chemotaxis family, protein-glutamate methylesterase/glutaminase
VSGDDVTTIAEDVDDQTRGARSGQTSIYSCPDCGGVLWQFADGDVPRFACHMGHAFEADTLVVKKSRALTQAIAEAARGLKEKALLLRQLAAAANPHSRNTGFLIEQADQDDEHARLLETHLLHNGKEDVVSSDPAGDIIAEMVREMRRAADD